MQVKHVSRTILEKYVFLEHPRYLLFCIVIYSQHKTSRKWALSLACGIF